MLLNIPNTIYLHISYATYSVHNIQHLVNKVNKVNIYSTKSKPFELCFYVINNISGAISKHFLIKNELRSSTKCE